MTRQVLRTSAVAPVLAATIFLLLTPHVSAQFSAAIQGVVKDSTGAVIPGATIVLTSRETGRVRETITGDAGFYRIDRLAPGVYTLTAQLAGFGEETIENLNVRAEEVQGVDLVLQPAGVTQEITVEADYGEDLRTESSDVARNISSREVKRLPQFGRDPYELVRLAPGVFGSGARSGNGGAVELPNQIGPGGSDLSVFQVENQVPISANGQRVSGNNFQIDGVRVNSLTWGGAAVVTPGQESVKEVRVLSSSFSAEDGRNSGAQIKVISKSGTNDFHGSAFFKFQDPALNAFNKYGGPNAPPTRVEQRFRQYGGSIGGPVLRDNLFFFFSYEGIRNNVTDFIDRYVETPEFRQLVQQQRPNGVTSAIFALPDIAPRITPLPVDCTAFGGRPCQVVNGGLDIGSLTGGLGDYVSFGNPAGGGLDGIPDLLFGRVSLPNMVRGNQYNTRVDFNHGIHSFAVSTYFTTRNDESSNGAAQGRPIADLRNSPFNSAATVLWNQILSPAILNEVRVNFTRFAFDQVQASQETNFGVPRVEVEGLPIGDRIRYGAPRGETTPAVFAQNTFGFGDTFSMILNNHSLKFGVEIHLEQNNNNLLGGARPLYSFSGLFNLANDAPIFETINADPVTGAPTDLQRYFRTQDLAFFAQDDWKVRPNLTFNVGLRYEIFTPPSETQDRLTRLIIGPEGLAGARVVVTDELFDTDVNNFGPRLGFAWTPERFENKLAVRGGFGIFYNRHPGVIFSNIRGNPPFFARYNLCCGTAEEDFGSPFANDTILYVLGNTSSILSYPINPALAVGIDPETGGPRGRRAEIYSTRPEFPTPYVYVYSLDTQYKLPAQLVATVGYQGSSSHKLVRTVNQPFLFQERHPTLDPIFFPIPDVNANFNALILRLTRSFAQGFQFDANYRWSKSIDQGSGEFGAATNQTYPFDLGTERGPSDFDVRHSFTLTGLWELPIFRNRTDALGRTLGGWQVNGIVTVHTGFPWTPVTGMRTSNLDITPSPSRPTAQLMEALDDSSDQAFIRQFGNFPGGGRLYFDTESRGVPGIGRNSFRGPQYSSVDLSIAKDTPFPWFGGEDARLNIRANFFNVFNSLNLANIGFGSASARIENDQFFGRSPEGLAGRVVEFQARIDF